ncbi:hypothetical protein [Mesorhizobium sp. CAU 1732]|uniref:hypothetical protein n=1 Tax=Mesorhizobium sp. CAU 1732 TaxID=3140358 RepID=UPI0032618D76
MKDLPVFEGLFGGGKSKSVVQDITASQDRIAFLLARDVIDISDGEWGNREWVELAVNHELDPNEDLRSSTQAIVLARHPNRHLEALGFRLSAQTKMELAGLRAKMDAAGQGRWTIADIVLDRGGTYTFSFRHEDPPRINGDLLHMPLKGYLERYNAR